MAKYYTCKICNETYVAQQFSNHVWLTHKLKLPEYYINYISCTKVYPTCKWCGKEVEFRGIAKGGFADFCSISCFSNEFYSHPENREYNSKITSELITERNKCELFSRQRNAGSLKGRVNEGDTSYIYLAEYPDKIKLGVSTNPDWRAYVTGANRLLAIVEGPAHQMIDLERDLFIEYLGKTLPADGRSFSEYLHLEHRDSLIQRLSSLPNFRLVKECV